MCQENFDRYMQEHKAMQNRITKLEQENRELKELLKDTYGNSIINKDKNN